MGDVLVGVVCIIAGIAILCGLALLSTLQPKDAWHAIGIAVGATLYSIVGELFILVGLSRMLGPASWVARAMRKARLSLAIALVATGVLVVVVVILILW